jgi:hypothetical protein
LDWNTSARKTIRETATRKRSLSDFFVMESTT